LALAGEPAPAGLDGAGLLPLAARCDRTSYSESFLPFFSYKWYPLRALATDRFLYIKAPRSSLYQLAIDPEEARDLAAEHPSALRVWDKRLRAIAGEDLAAAAPAPSALPEEERRQLASLGYLSGGGGGEVRNDLPDPRRMTDVAQALHAAAESVQQGRCAEALPQLRSIVQRDPRNVPALSLAGTCLLAVGRAESALALFQRASRENELSAIPAAGVAQSLLALGKKAEAEKEYRRALALDPSMPEAASSLARLLRGRGERDDALRVLDAALAAGGKASVVYLERGRVRAESGRLAEALNDFREAARRSPTDPAPLESAARAAYQLGRHRESVQFYEQLLRLAPNRLDLWKTAGAIYLNDLDDRPAALRCFRRALALEPDPAERTKLDELVRELGG
jgi:tetratricopeptide (TPR) repeat protein